MILMWDKPKKAQSTADWKNSYGFEAGPAGGYMPNMSQDDEERWKAKLTGVKSGFPQVEIRKSTLNGTLMLIIVNLGAGYNYKYYTTSSKFKGHTPATIASLDNGGWITTWDDTTNSPRPTTQQDIDDWIVRDTTVGVNVHISMNGPAQLTFEDMDNMQKAVAEAKLYLINLQSNDKTLGA